MKAILLMGLLLGISAQVFAQTEADMCVSVTDVCCDGNWSSVEYTIPTGQWITKTFIRYDGDEDNKVILECWDIVGGIESTRFWILDDLCGCGSMTATLGHPIGQNHTLRFKVNCRQCEDHCVSGNTRVTFFTSARPACAANCNQ